MSIQEFREIFQREIGSHLGKLQRKSQERGPAGAAAAGPLPAPQEEGFQDWELAELRRLANCMADSILNQLADHASYWELDGSGEADQDGASPIGEEEARVRAAVAAEADAAHRQLELECAELERVLEQKKAEEARRREELAAKLKAECDAAVQAKEQELLALQQAAMSRGPPGAGPAGSAEMVADMETHITRIHSRLATAKEAIARLESRRAGLEKIETLQSQPLSAAETLLAGAAAGSTRGGGGGGGKAAEEEAEQEAALLAAIQKGELVCKRMRRHFGGA